MKLAFTVTDSYVDYMATTLLSILETNQVAPITVYLLTSGISDYSRYKLDLLKVNYPHLTIEVILVESDSFANLPLNRSHITRPEVYFRLAFASLLPESVERVLYLDSDLLVQEDLSNLWATDLEGCYMAGVSEPSSEGAFVYRRSIGMTNPSIYINSGVLIMDLKKMREDQIQAHLFETAEQIKDKILLQDQDIINVALEGRIKLLDVTYNYGYMERMAELKPEAEVAIMHFSLEKPWDRSLDVTDYNRSAVDTYTRCHQRYRHLIEPLVTVLVLVDQDFTGLDDTLTTLREQVYRHLDVVLVDQSEGQHAVALSAVAVASEGCRYAVASANQSPSFLANTLALGAYVTVLAAGDLLDPTYLSQLCQTLRDSRADVVVTTPTFLNRATGIYTFFDPVLHQGDQVSGKHFLDSLSRTSSDLSAYYQDWQGCLVSKAFLSKTLPLLMNYPEARPLETYALGQATIAQGPVKLYVKQV